MKQLILPQQKGYQAIVFDVIGFREADDVVSLLSIVENQREREGGDR